MKKTIYHSCICALCFTIASSCSKDVKVPSARTTTAGKTTSTGATTTTQNQDQNSNTCGGNSTSSGSETGY